MVQPLCHRKVSYPTRTVPISIWLIASLLCNFRKYSSTKYHHPTAPCVISARYYLYHPTFTSIPYYSQTNFFKPTSIGLSYPIYLLQLLSFNVVFTCTLFSRWLWYMYYTPILLGPPSSAIGVKREERSAIKLSLSASLENRASPTQTPRDRQSINR